MRRAPLLPLPAGLLLVVVVLAAAAVSVMMGVGAYAVARESKLPQQPTHTHAPQYVDLVPEILQEYEALRPQFVEMAPVRCPAADAREAPPVDLRRNALVFHHIPKTAGGSMRAALATWYEAATRGFWPEGARLTFVDKGNKGSNKGGPKKSNSASPAKPSTSLPVCTRCMLKMGCNYRQGSNCASKSELKTNCVAGAKGGKDVQRAQAAPVSLIMDHIELGFERALYAGVRGEVPPTARITMYREPVAVHSSMFLYVRPLKGQHFMNQGFKNLTCAQFFQSFDHWIQKRVGATYHVHYNTNISAFHLWSIFPCGMECHCDLAAGRMSEEQLIVRSINNIRQKFAAVGLTEHLDDFLAMIGAITQTKPPRIDATHHIANPKEKLACAESLHTEEARTAIRQSRALRQYALIWLAAKEVYETQRAALTACLPPASGRGNSQPAQSKTNATTTSTALRTSTSSSSSTASSSDTRQQERNLTERHRQRRRLLTP